MYSAIIDGKKTGTLVDKTTEAENKEKKPGLLSRIKNYALSDVYDHKSVQEILTNAIGWPVLGGLLASGITAATNNASVPLSFVTGAAALLTGWSYVAVRGAAPFEVGKKQQEKSKEKKKQAYNTSKEFEKTEDRQKLLIDLIAEKKKEIDAYISQEKGPLVEVIEEQRKALQEFSKELYDTKVNPDAKSAKEKLQPNKEPQKQITIDITGVFEKIKERTGLSMKYISDINADKSKFLKFVRMGDVESAIDEVLELDELDRQKNAPKPRIKEPKPLNSTPPKPEPEPQNYEDSEPVEEPVEPQDSEDSEPEENIMYE
jgi:hypothetical protein